MGAFAEAVEAGFEGSRPIDTARGPADLDGLGTRSGAEADVRGLVWPPSTALGQDQHAVVFASPAKGDKVAWLRDSIVAESHPLIDGLNWQSLLVREGMIVPRDQRDRVLLWQHCVVPQWTYGKVRSARWDRFGRPNELPKYGLSAFPTVWWWDADKAAKAGTRS